MQRSILHRLSLRALAAAFAVLAGGACAGSHRADGPQSAAVPHLPALLAQMGSPDEIAVWATRECRKVRSRQMACYDGALHDMLGPRGVRPTMEALARMTALDTAVQRDGHVYAHGIGIAAFRGADQVAATFAECTPLHQSGCYHGVIQAYFADAQARGGPITAQTTNAVCREQADTWLLFQCAHGIGHGFTALYGHDLRRALAGCDMLASGFERESCYGGAFMENIVAVSSPEHHHEINSALNRIAAGTPAAQHTMANGMVMAGAEHAEHSEGGEHAEHAAHEEGGEHAGHEAHAAGEEHAGHVMAEGHEGMAGMGGMAGMPGMEPAAGAWKPVDPRDMQYPCSVLGPQYQVACYSMQTSVMLYVAKGDMAAVARGCEAAPERMRNTCFASFGRDITAYARQQHAAAIRMCGVASGAYRGWCHLGVAKNLIDLTSRAEDGASYCAEVPGQEDRSRCFQGVGEEMRYLIAEPARREAICRMGGDASADLCRRGAGLVTPRAGSSSR